MKAKLLKKLRKQSIKLCHIEVVHYEYNDTICMFYRIVSGYVIEESRLNSIENAIDSLKFHRRKYILCELARLKQIKMQKYLNTL